MEEYRKQEAVKTQEVTGMFEPLARFAGITIEVDPVNRPRTDASDNVMAIFWEEQGMWWEFAKNDIKSAIKTVAAPIDFLDVGTGSGVMAILAAKHAGAKHIIAIDKSRRAVDVAQENAKKNEVVWTLKNELYNKNTAPHRFVKVISLNAPYHLYPPEIAGDMPQHARGGIDGQEVFKEQLAIANEHLAEGGIISFHQMCLGRNGRPAFAEYIPTLIKGASLKYMNIFPPVKSADFFKKVYVDRFPEYQKEMSAQYPELYFCNGIITRDDKGEIKEVPHHIDPKGTSWETRFKLHQQISAHASRVKNENTTLG